MTRGVIHPFIAIMFYETLSDLIQAAIIHADDERFFVVDTEEAFRSVCFGGLAYGESRSLSVEIGRKDGKRTNKCLQVSIQRFGLQDGNLAGRYEGVFYIL